MTSTAEMLREHARRDMWLAYAYAILAGTEAVVGTAAIVAALFVARHNQMWLLLLPLAAASFVLVDVNRRRRPGYRTRTWRLRRDFREGALGRSAGLALLADDVRAQQGSDRRWWWGQQLGGIGQVAALGIITSACGAPQEFALTAGAVWLVVIGAAANLENLLYISAVHAMLLLPEVPADR